jgi:ABC-type Fe3+/spermidine/putrescine transport system ATPase subunit
VSRLVLTEVSRRFGSVTAVDRFSLSLAQGEFVSLLGPSGCGKTTTLRIIAGFLEPSAGTIEMDGRTISSPASTLPPEKRGMSMIFQSYAIWPNMTVAENVAFGLEVRRLPKAEIRTRVDKILDVVQMGHLGGRYPQELSGGQQQRVALARAIVVQPAVLLLDEPLSNLDANLREEMRYEIRRTSLTTRPRPWSHPTGSRSCTRGGSSRWTPPARSTRARAPDSWPASSAAPTSSTARRGARRSSSTTSRSPAARSRIRRPSGAG